VYVRFDLGERVQKTIAAAFIWGWGESRNQYEQRYDWRLTQIIFSWKLVLLNSINKFSILFGLDYLPLL
jgi:hypothetical protein